MSIEAPETFNTGSQSQKNNKHKNYLRNKAKYTSASADVTPNISVMEQLEDIMHTNEIQYDIKKINKA